MRAEDHQSLMDEARLYCRDACFPIACMDFNDAAKKLMARVKELDMALQSLTPGGSEYVGDPARCVEYAKSFKQDAHKWRIHQAEMAKRYKSRITQDVPAPGECAEPPCT